MENRLAETLASGAFVLTVEVVAPERAKPLGPALAPVLRLARALATDARIAGLSVTDRVRSDDDHDPVRIALELAWASGKAPLVHLSGKDRAPADLLAALDRMEAWELRNLLCVTGDRLKAPPTDRAVRFLESVYAIQIARARLPDSLIAGAVSPFKYTEEETHSQYVKMAKKHAAGADYVITQVGWDMAKFWELARYRAREGLRQPLMANVMLLPLGAARYIHKGAVPGVVVTDDLVTLVESEAQAPDKGLARRYERAALQVVGLERMGYAGVQLSGLSRYEDVSRLLDGIAAWRAKLPTLATWWSAWEESIRLPGGTPARLHPRPAYFVFDGAGAEGAAGRLTGGQRARYQVLRTFGQAIFHPSSPIPRLLRPLARRVPADSAVADWLVRIEHAVKAPLFGCQACGFCRLPDTFYVCPETCPKGLANGPCGGSTNNVCEAGDRECIHVRRYRIAKATGQLDRLGATLIPSVPEPRGGSSWLNHWAGRDPAVSPAEDPGSREDRRRDT